MTPVLSPEENERVSVVCERYYAAADRIAARVRSEFERLSRKDPGAIADTRHGYIDKEGTVDFDRAPVKYAIHARKHMAQKLRYLPYLKDLRLAFDIGVGPAQMFLLLRDALRVEMRGIDAPEAEGAFLYEAFWREFAIADDIAPFTVKAGIDVPIPKGAAVLALWPIFDRGWGIDEHAWFTAMCARHGAERVVWRFNMLNAAESILDFYRERQGTETPRENDPGFLVVRLGG
jgi:hypothetical protein